MTGRRHRPQPIQLTGSFLLFLKVDRLFGGSVMQLMTKEVRSKLPPLYSQEHLGGKAVAQVKFFTPDSNWTWWATEYDGEDTFFGLVDGQEKELGYFSLKELESVRGPLGLPIERDLYWKPKTLEEIAPELFAPAARTQAPQCDQR